MPFSIFLPVFIVGWLWSATVWAQVDMEGVAHDRIKAFGFQEVFLCTFMDMGVNQYYNASLLPNDYQIALGVGVYAPVVRSDADFSAGLYADVKLGRSIILENSYIARIPVALAFKYGAGSVQDCPRRLGVAVGLGAEGYYLFKEPINRRDRSIYPMVYLEFAWRMGSRVGYMRYQYYYGSTYMSNTSGQMGFYLDF